MRRVLILCNSEVKNTFEQIFEVRAAGAENHLVGSQCLPSGRQRHVHKVLIFQKAFEGICQRSLKNALFKDNTINSSNCQEKENFVEQHFWLAQSRFFCWPLKMLLQIYLIIIPLQAELVGHLGYLCLHFFLFWKKGRFC